MARYTLVISKEGPRGRVDITSHFEASSRREALTIVGAQVRQGEMGVAYLNGKAVISTIHRKPPSSAHRTPTLKVYRPRRAFKRLTIETAYVLKAEAPSQALAREIVGSLAASAIKVEETATQWRFRQIPPSHVRPGTFRTKIVIRRNSRDPRANGLRMHLVLGDLQARYAPVRIRR